MIIAQYDNQDHVSLTKLYEKFTGVGRWFELGGRQQWPTQKQVF